MAILQGWPKTTEWSGLACVASVSSRVIAGTKTKWKGEGEGRRGNTCPQTPRFWKTPLHIVWFQKISITTPRMVIGNSKGEGDIKGQNFLKEGMKLNWNFQRGGGMQTKIPSLGEVWIFSGTTHFTVQFIRKLTARQDR